VAGFYIHIPYCRQACIYCNFYFSTVTKTKDAFLQALAHEIKHKTNYLAGETVETIYFGGGTPSILETGEIKNILNLIKENYKVIAFPEITLEANPDDLSPEVLQKLKKAGINRLSIGIQSFHEEDIIFLNRAHSAAQSIKCIEDAKKAGFENITIDLIYGIPGQTDEKWLKNLDILRELDIPHFSAYALTVEPKTQLDYLIQKQKLTPVDDEQTSRHFHLLIQWAEANNYIHYEISNFCREGMYSRHNTAYWQGTKYIGAGPSAHSFDLQSRQWNVANNSRYIKNILEGTEYFEKEILTATQKYNEYLMTSLRTLQGCDLLFIEKNFGKEFLEVLHKESAPYIAKNLLLLKDNTIVLSREAKILADGIIADLFIIEEND
jgi:putative oxygen-independent coproporphyrinogen III oxidase